MESKIIKTELATLERKKKIIKTHKNFLSIHPDIKSADKIWSRMGDALQNQHLLNRVTTPWEKEDITDIYFDLEKLDRLYYLFDTGYYGDIRNCILIGRIDLSWYVAMKCFHYNSKKKGWCGLIYLTREPLVFFNVLCECWHLREEKTNILENIRLCMKQKDDIEVYKLPPYNKLEWWIKIIIHRRKKKEKQTHKMIDKAITYFINQFSTRMLLFSTAGPCYLSASRKKLNY